MQVHAGFSLPFISSSIVQEVIFTALGFVLFT
jgi:hypothetical protein